MQIRRLGMVSRTYRHINRYRQILTVFLKYGFGDLVDRLNIGHFFDMPGRLRSQRGRAKMERQSRAERVRMAIEELGPTFIKLAQVLSTRPDLIPADFVQEFAKLQDQVSPFPVSSVHEIIEMELKAPLSEILTDFQESPLASASIGQVHRARLPSGEEVAIKVQRPGIQRTIEVDLEILLHLASLVEKHLEEWAVYRPTRIVEEFSRALAKELDYTIEASQAKRFARQFSSNPWIRVPRVVRSHSTMRVLTMEYMEGIKISEIATLDEQGFDRKLLASRGADLIFAQIFQHGFFHGDPHPGNILVLPGNILCYLDYGMMGIVDRQSREDFADLLFAYVQGNELRVVQALRKIVSWEKEPDRRALARDVANLMGSMRNASLKHLRMDDFLKQISDLIRRHRLHFPEEIFLMAKAMATAEGVGCLLDPDFDLIKKATPLMLRARAARFSPRRILGEFFDAGGDWIHLIQSVPAEINDILQQVKLGKMKIEFEHRGLENFIHQMDRSSNRLSFSLIIAALIIGSSLIIQTQIEPHLFGFPLLGIMGFSIAGILGVGLLISILRSGKF